jgi:8-oxo-dGTP diphosphatase
MSEQHDRFDEEKLTALKNRNCGYRFCPRCGTGLVEREFDEGTRLACPDDACGFIFYHNPVPAAGAIIVEEDKVLLVQRAHPPRIGWWCIPAGFMEWNEHPSQTAVRELAEETGFEVELTSLFEIYAGSDDPRTNAVLVLYLARITGGSARAADDALDVAWFGFEELPERIAFVSHRQALADYQERYR